MVIWIIFAVSGSLVFIFGSEKFPSSKVYYLLPILIHLSRRYCYKLMLDGFLDFEKFSIEWYLICFLLMRHKYDTKICSMGPAARFYSFIWSWKWSRTRIQLGYACLAHRRAFSSSRRILNYWKDHHCHHSVWDWDKMQVAHSASPSLLTIIGMCLSFLTTS